ncbi:MAG: segregation/condensation protein A [Peptococcaceae bacterium]|jgi:segregation and condensation protein A|nr:segregation/condensation protein A [Peptococcaceae bacterium]
MGAQASKPIFETAAFQGPLDLLLQLIQQEKVDIYDIPIAKIADQFVLSIRQMESMDMEITSEFLVLAAQLLYIKSRYLLPKPELKEELSEEADPRLELVARLEAYRAFKQAAAMLAEREASSGQRYFRDVDVSEILLGFPQPDALNGVSFADLWIAFRRVAERAEKGVETRHIEPDEISVEMMITDILRRLLLKQEGIYFRRLLRVGSKLEMITVFLAILELLKNGQVRAEQISPPHDIYIIPTERAWEFTEEEE